MQKEDQGNQSKTIKHDKQEAAKNLLLLYFAYLL